MPEDVASFRSREQLAKFELEDIDFLLRKSRLHWYGHVEPSSGAVRTACGIQVDVRAREVQDAMEEIV